MSERLSSRQDELDRLAYKGSDLTNGEYRVMKKGGNGSHSEQD
jgi:hypothetical protein